jgi:hypothetical protein
MIADQTKNSSLSKHGCVVVEGSVPEAQKETRSHAVAADSLRYVTGGEPEVLEILHCYKAVCRSLPMQYFDGFGSYMNTQENGENHELQAAIYEALHSR